MELLCKQLFIVVYKKMVILKIYKDFTLFYFIHNIYFKK